MRKAIIGGTGVYSLKDKKAGEYRESAGRSIDAFCLETKTVITEYGAVEVDILRVEGNTIGSNEADCGDRPEDSIEIVFLARHGKSHSVPPHLINYRANMMALKMLEVDEIYATCAVGSMKPAFGIGDVVLLKDFIDFTKARTQTFFDGSEGGVKHVIMDAPYCPNLSKAFMDYAGDGGIGSKSDIDLKGEAIYVCTEGPRFETAAEISMYWTLGGDVVGMTNVPECVLAKELGMCYSAVGIVTNWCTGIKPESIGLHDIGDALEKNKILITDAFISILIKEDRLNNSIDDEKMAKCRCGNSLISL